MSTKIFRLSLWSLLLGSAAFSPALEADSAPRRHVVEIRDFGFHPDHIRVSAGDTVTWINRDIVPHTATENRGAWDSGEIDEKQTWEVPLRRMGKHSYYCDFHPHMKAVVEVRR